MFPWEKSYIPTPAEEEKNDMEKKRKSKKLNLKKIMKKYPLYPVFGTAYFKLINKV
jgi:hypothetical protein|tara:strand:+ start:1404 stop:1571 length:168 start_codon:yes stop_codon:yes gene_type:complete